MAGVSKDQQKQLAILGGLVVVAVVVLFVYPGILVKKAPTPAPKPAQPAAATENKPSTPAAGDNRGGFSSDELGKDSLPAIIVINVKKADAGDPYIAKWAPGPGPGGANSSLFEIEAFFDDLVKIKGVTGYQSKGMTLKKDGKDYEIIRVDSIAEEFEVVETSTGLKITIQKSKPKQD